MKIKEMLDLLATAYGVSGFEEDIKNKAKELIEPFCDEVYFGKTGSLIALRRSGNENAKRLMIEAHLDRVGLMVSKIYDDGFIGFSNIGGIDARILPASEVKIIGKETVFGIVGALPPHLKSDSNSAAFPKITEMLIDTGYKKEELEAKITIGDPIVIENKPQELLGLGCFGSAMDNRAGMAAVAFAMENIEKSPYDIYVVFSTEEEIGLLGAASAVKEIAPDLAVVVDVTHGKTPDTKDDVGVFETGGGTVICRGPSLDNALSKELLKLAKEKKIKYDIEVAAGHSGTNAWAIQTACGGVRTALLSIPLKYMHTPVEVLDISDIKETAKLIKAIAEGGLFDA